MRLIVAGGGTGGHLYPGIAIAEEIIRRGGEVLFVGTARGLEARVVPAAGYALELIDVTGIKRTGVAGMARGLARVPTATWQSRAILRRFHPDVVLGVGGYASGPLVLAAALSGYPTAILEQNSVPGFTNRMLGRFVLRVFLAFDGAARGFSPAKIRMTGNPVRRSFSDAGQAPEKALPGPALLVLGGSQGARAVNDLVLAAVEVLAGQGILPALVHQTGQEDHGRCLERYAALGLADRVSVRPFIDDVAAAYRAADLVIGRAGALTLAELAVLGKPALLIPLPTAADDHQFRNARAFADAGAAVIVDQRHTSGAELAALVRSILADDQRRSAMSSAMVRLGRADATSTIVDLLAHLR